MNPKLQSLRELILDIDKGGCYMPAVTYDEFKTWARASTLKLSHIDYRKAIRDDLAFFMQDIDGIRNINVSLDCMSYEIVYHSFRRNKTTHSYHMLNFLKGNEPSKILNSHGKYYFTIKNSLDYKILKYKDSSGCSFTREFERFTFCTKPKAIICSSYISMLSIH